MSLQLIWRRETALPSPLYHSDATGIDMTTDIISGSIRLVLGGGRVYEIVDYRQLLLVNPPYKIHTSPNPAGHDMTIELLTND